jgi:very-short-patch-repair endonuclease
VTERDIFDHPRHAKGAVKRSRRLRLQMTWGEKELWRALRKLKLNVRRQAPIGRYIADFACHEARLVIEIDGGWHDLPEAQLHDAIRDAWLRSQGYRILRFRDRQVSDDFGGVVEAITESLPPRWGKGGDGGGRAEDSGKTMEAEMPLQSVLKPAASTPTQPSPIEGEGAPNSDPAPIGLGQ